MSFPQEEYNIFFFFSYFLVIFVIKHENISTFNLSLVRNNLFSSKKKKNSVYFPFCSYLFLNIKEKSILNYEKNYTSYITTIQFCYINNFNFYKKKCKSIKLNQIKPNFKSVERTDFQEIN